MCGGGRVVRERERESVRGTEKERRGERYKRETEGKKDKLRIFPVRK